MLWLITARLTFGLGILAAGAQTVRCQQLNPLPVGFQQSAAHTSASRVDFSRSALALGGTSVGWASVGAVLGGGVGLIVDDQYCKHYHEREKGSLFGPCFAYAGGGAATGWFGGAVVGATVGATRVAHKRGCPPRAAKVRAVAGAVLGVVPGLSVVIRRPGKYPPGRAALVFTAPLLAGAGASVAVLACRAPGVRPSKEPQHEGRE